MLPVVNEKAILYALPAFFAGNTVEIFFGRYEIAICCEKYLLFSPMLPVEAVSVIFSTKVLYRLFRSTLYLTQESQLSLLKPIFSFIIPIAIDDYSLRLNN